MTFKNRTIDQYQKYQNSITGIVSINCHGVTLIKTVKHHLNRLVDRHVTAVSEGFQVRNGGSLELQRFFALAALGLAAGVSSLPDVGS